MKQTSSEKAKRFKVFFDKVTRGMSEYQKKLLLDGLIKEVGKRTVV